MSNKFHLPRQSRVLLAISATALLAACSSDIERLKDYPPVDNTASVASNQVETKPLTPADNANSPWNAPTPSWSGGNGGYAAPVRSAAAVSGTLIVQPGQTLFSIARANGKTVQELMAANGLSSPSIRVGQRLVIPGVANPVSPAPTVQHAAGTTAYPAAAPARAITNTASVRQHRVQPGETWYALGRKYGVHPRKIAAYNGLTLSQGLRVGQVVKIPPSEGWRMARRPAAPPAAGSAASVRKDGWRQGASTGRTEKDEDRLSAENAAPSSARFAWPVNGRVIAGFGRTKNGLNEGINIAAPEGSPIRAAADGVVAYAGNELKDYGNLILIRHKGGWVTAYAHARDLKVQRGDHVKKGQIIATVGKTGAVKSAQLHFELRKGATPVDPRQYLGTSTAMR